MEMENLMIAGINKHLNTKMLANRNSNVNVHRNSNFNQNAYGAISRQLENRLKFQCRYRRCCRFDTFDENITLYRGS